MDINNIVDIMVNAMVADSSILNWCNNKYSSPHTIYKGIDLRKPPPQEDYPCIHIWPMAKNVGYDLKKKAHTIGVVCGLYDETITTTTDTNEVVFKKYQGIEYIEDFRYLVETAITAELESNVDTLELFIDSVAIEYENIESFPFFLAINIFELNENYSQGDEVFE